MKNDQIIIFTDGASQGNPGPGGWGAIIAYDNEVKEIGGREDMTTNNRMELMGAIKALESLGEVNGNVTVHTDSSYVMQGITKWVRSWSERNWITAAKKPVLNKDLWLELMDIVKRRERMGTIDWKLVAGHSGIPGNERVDIIATAFTERRLPDLYNGPQSVYPVNLLALVANRTKKIVKSDKRNRSKAQAYSYVSMVKGVILTHATWAECEMRVRGVKNTRFKKALSKEEEKEIIQEFRKGIKKTK
jgi:ribonuclease HI